MKKITTFSLVTLALFYFGNLGAAKAERPDCSPFNDKNTYYFDSNGLIIFNSQLNIEENQKISEAPIKNYLKRLATTFKTHGSQLVIVPLPSFGYVWAGRLQREEAEGTPSTALMAPDYLSKRLRINEERLKIYRSLGFSTTDYMRDALAFMHQNPKIDIYNRQDTHWIPAGSRLAAKAVAATLKKSNPTLAHELNLKQYDIKFGTRDYLKHYGFPEIIREKCPTTSWKPYTEDIATAESISLTPESLLGDGSPPVLLLGSSYSTPYLGFPPYLQQELGNDIVNESVAGGGIFGSLRNFYAKADASARWPKLVIWEFPDDICNFTELEFRQLFPLMLNSSAVETHTGQLTNQPLVVNLTNQNAAGPQYFMEFKFDSPPERELQITLNYGATQEKLTLSKKTGDAPDRFAVELSGSQTLKSIQVQNIADYQGKVVVNLRRYDSQELKNLHLDN